MLLRSALGLVSGLCVLFVLLGPAHGAESAEAAAARLANYRRAIQSIVADELQLHVNVLSNDTYEGRLAGSRGGKAAAHYLADQLQRIKAPGGFKGQYFQPFQGDCRNVLSLIPGSDAELGKEVIVVGAHYDHVGYGKPENSYGPYGRIHNGADDNASGTAALLEVTEALLQLEPRPKRSILLAWWDMEEAGLHGSKYWLANPTAPLKQVPLAFNMDMIGRLRNGKLEVYGVRTAPGLRQFVARQNSGDRLWLDFPWDMKEDSDHYPFFEKSIPVLMLHTGLHDDYHRPSDDAERVNKQGMEDIARLLFGLVYDAAERDQLPKFRSRSRNESNATAARVTEPLPALPARLGVTWSDPPRVLPGEAIPAEEGMYVSRVTAGSAADRAGVRVGDRILAIGDEPVRDDREFRRVVLAAPSTTTISFRKAGAKEPTVADLRLPGSPVRVGLSWRVDEAEPGVVVLNRVVPGSPADVAKLQVHDRVLSIKGQTFASGEEFLTLIDGASGRVELEVERRGRTVQVLMDLRATAPLTR